jgi:hypothetical protein
MSDTRSGTFAAVAILLIAGALALGNILLFGLAIRQLGGGPEQSFLTSALSAYQSNPAFLIYVLAAHALAGALLAIVFLTFRETASSGASGDRVAEAPKADSPAPALRLLALLQQEGRFIDFVQEDIDAYSDTQVGAAARAIHAGCRKVLHEHMQIDRIFTQDEGTEIVVPAGFDATAIRLSGNVHGQPPFRGRLEHSGWRTRAVTLPQGPAEIDPHVLAPAEVEVA